LGMLLWGGIVTALVLLSTLHSGKSSVVLLGGLVAVLPLVLIFVKVELKQKIPLFPLTLFRQRFYFIGMLCAALSFAVLFVVLILMPFYLDYILGLPAQKIGFVMMAVPLTVFMIAPLSGMLYDRIGARFLTTSGLAIAALSLFLICLLNMHSTPFDVAWRLALLGCGQALFLSPNSAGILDTIPHEQAGVTSGMLATARNFGMLLGVMFGGLLFGLLFNHLSGGYDLKQYQPLYAEAFMKALSVTFGATAVLAVCGAFLSGLRRGKL